MVNLKLNCIRVLKIKRSPRRPLRNGFLIFGVLSVAVATDQNAFAVSLLPVITQAAVDLPPTPFLVSWCEGKSCEHRFTKQVVCKAIVYEDARSDSKKVGELKVGDKIENRILMTKILKLGSYLPLEGISRILVSRLDKHTWVSFFDHAWDSEIDPSDPVTFPMTEGWALIKTKKGLSGFVKLEGQDTKSCPLKVLPYELAL